MIVSKRSQTISLSAAALLCTFFIGLSYWLGALTTLQAQLTDRFFTPTEVSSDIIIIDIDEESLATLGQWPWSRTIHAQVLQRLNGAKAVGFDVIFTEPAPNPEEDEMLVNAVTAFPGTVLLPAIVDEQSGRTVLPIETLREKTTSALVNINSERDGVVRYLATRRAGLVSMSALLAESEGPDIIRVYYHGPVKTYTTISYLDVYQGTIPAEIFKDKTILIGASAAGLGDVLQTPFGVMPGVEIHANAIDTIRNGQFLQETSLENSLGLLVLGSLLILAVFLRLRSTLWLTTALLGIFVGTITVAYVAFDFNLVIPHVYLIVLFVLETGALLLLRYLFESKEKHFIRTSFTHYLAPEVVEQLCAEPARLGLGGESREVSILFSDIRGFTSISETLTPHELMQQLNEYLEEMSEAVITHKGLVDKYIGDAVMAFWGAPLENPHHAADACESVIAMMRALELLNHRWAAAGRPVFKIGVGVSTGEVIVGNMGSHSRFNYSIIGDEVNFSARIESLTKEYGVGCLIGEATYTAIKHVAHLPTREIDEVMVKGKLEPRKIYQLITDEITPEQAKAFRLFELGRKEYQKGNFAEAATHFTSALDSAPVDGPSLLFLKRTEKLKREPPTDWKGVFVFETK